MGRTACTAPQCLYKGALYLLPFSLSGFPQRTVEKTHKRHTFNRSSCGPQNCSWVVWVLLLLRHALSSEKPRWNFIRFVMSTDEFYFVPCYRTYLSYMNLFFLMKPTRFTLLLSIFISTSLHFSGNNVQTRQPPIQSKKYQSRIDTVSSPDDGHIVARNM